MRLIDADKLMLSLADWELQEAPIHTYEKPKEFTADDMQRMIWRTIRDCESAVEEQPTVKAIPIDYIEKWIDARARIIKINPPAFRELLATKLLDDWLAGREPDWHIKFEVKENESRDTESTK